MPSQCYGEIAEVSCDDFPLTSFVSTILCWIIWTFEDFYEDSVDFCYCNLFD